MASRSSNAPPDLEWKRDAVEAFGRDDADEQQTTWLKGKRINTNKPASEQAGRLHAILTEAKTDVVDNFRAKKKLSSGDKTFLKSKGIKPDTPAADQDASINALVGQLATQRQATVTFDSTIANAPPDLEWKRKAVKAFRRVEATDAQKQWLMEEGVAIDGPATEQTGRLDAILVQAQIEVVDNFRAENKPSSGDTENFRAEETLSSGDKKFLKSKGIKPDTPVADQDARLEGLVTTLQQQANDALARQVTYDTQAPQVCSLCTVCVADVTWHLLHAGKHDAGRSCEDEAACVVPAQ